MTESASRFSRYTVGDDIAFFDTKTQSFLRPLGWGQIYLSGLADGLDENELAREIASHCGESIGKVTDEVQRFLTEIESIDTSQPLALDNRKIYANAKTAGTFPCRFAGVKRCNAAKVTVGFDNEKLRDSFQALTFNSLELSDNKLCDVYVREQNGRIVIDAAGRLDSVACSLRGGVLAAYSTIDDLLAKRLDTLFIAHAGAVSKEGVAALLPALGSSGKSTLVAGLGLCGYDIINDDIVPVLENGTLVSLGGIVKLRETAWPVVESLGTDIGCLPIIKSEHHKPVKLMQTERASKSTPNPSFYCQIILIPKYDPDTKPRLERIPPLEALYKLVESESLFKKPAESETLDRICSWVGAKECYRISYPDTDSGLSLVEEVFDSVSSMLATPRQNSSNRRTGRV